VQCYFEHFVMQVHYNIQAHFEDCVPLNY